MLENRPLADYEDPSPPADGEDDDDAWGDCPLCGGEVYEDAVRCPSCGEYLEAGFATRDGGPWSGRSVWWVALGLLGMVATIAALAL